MSRKHYRVKNNVRTSPGVERLEDRWMMHHCLISFSQASYSVTESAGTATITLTRSVAAGDVSVDFTASAGTADSSDFTPITSLTIPWLNSDPNTKTVQIAITPDAIKEANETVQLSLSNFVSTFPGSITSAKLTIFDDDSTPPVIANFGAAVSYAENGAAKPISTTATITDADSANFSGGKLTVRYTAGGTAADRLAIRDTTSITINASKQIVLNGNVVGTVAGGSGTTPLVMSLNDRASPAVATTLLRNVVYSNVSDNPALTRTVSVDVTDGDGATSAVVSKIIKVSPSNDAPVLGGSASTVNYAHDTTAIALAPGATVTDVDSLNFANGELRVSITGVVNASNRLELAGFTVNPSNQVLLNGVVVGTRTSSGVGTNNLVVKFSANATPAIAQQMVRAIRFRTDGGAAGTRNISITVSDGDGGLSSSLAKVVKVT